MILASIVEKETGRADERTRVAGVFINRLNKRMKLQSDPTIVYGLVGGKGTLGRGIQRSEIEQRDALQHLCRSRACRRAPIANPGRAALEAVANPSRTKDLYFVADGSGGHVFAETLDQHQRNVARWRQIEKSAPAPSRTRRVDRVDPARMRRGRRPRRRRRPSPGCRRPRARAGRAAGGRRALRRQRGHGARPAAQQDLRPELAQDASRR